SYFFPDADDSRQGMVAAAPEITSFLETNEGRDLNLAFSRISSNRMRRKIVGLVTALADAFQPEDVSGT
ncbi:hypothetical protein, partial [Klebsiella pneumoniae]